MISVKSYARIALKTHYATLSLIDAMSRNTSFSQEDRDEVVEFYLRETTRWCYYASFLLARSFAQARDFSLADDTGHTEVWNWYFDSSYSRHHALEDVAVKGFRSFARRKWADYEIQTSYEGLNSSLASAANDMFAIAGHLSPKDIWTELEAIKAQRKEP